MKIETRSLKQHSALIARHSVLCAALCAMLFALCTTAEAQQRATVPKIGVLSSAGTAATPGSQIEAFRQGLRQLGYIEGNNILVEYRYAQGEQDRMPSLVTELVQLRVDVLVVTALTAIRAAKHATKTIPIVMVILSDPVATGIVDSLARPGGNITGFTRLTRELSGKRLELFKEAVPQLSRAAVLWDADSPGSAASFKDYEAAAHSLRIPIQSLKMTGSNPDFELPSRQTGKSSSNGLLSINNALLRRHAKHIADVAMKNRLPSMHEGSDYTTAGGLMSYSANETEAYTRAALYVDKILKGAKPAELPVEQPTKFEFVINLKTAKQIGLTIPPNVLARADKVIK
jgi:putative ABC transport system substrate-binding protein